MTALQHIDEAARHEALARNARKTGTDREQACVHEAQALSHRDSAGRMLTSAIRAD